MTAEDSIPLHVILHKKKVKRMYIYVMDQISLLKLLLPEFIRCGFTIATLHSCTISDDFEYSDKIREDGKRELIAASVTVYSGLEIGRKEKTGKRR